MKVQQTSFLSLFVNGEAYIFFDSIVWKSLAYNSIVWKSLAYNITLQYSFFALQDI